MRVWWKKNVRLARGRIAVAEELAADIRSSVRIPCIGVIGNHDYESGQPEAVAKVLDGTGVNMLNGEAVEIAGVGFAGICGFGGGFGRRMLNAWGEPLIKEFVQESISHAIRLEQALVKLQTERRIVVLHYSPIRATLHGEDPEIYAFLGSSRLEEPINRFRVTAAFHGHAHNGILDGKTSAGIPASWNVSAMCRPVSVANSEGLYNTALPASSAGTNTLLPTKYG